MVFDDVVGVDDVVTPTFPYPHVGELSSMSCHVEFTQAYKVNPLHTSDPSVHTGARTDVEEVIEPDVI